MKQARRFGVVYLDLLDLEELLTSGNTFRVVQPLPEGAKFVSASRAHNQMALDLIFEHESFDECFRGSFIREPGEFVRFERSDNITRPHDKVTACCKSYEWHECANGFIYCENCRGYLEKKLLLEAV